jgi:hypothetical protein
MRVSVNRMAICLAHSRLPSARSSLLNLDDGGLIVEQLSSTVPEYVF